MFTQEELEKKSLLELLQIYVQADKLANEKNQLEYLNMVRGYILANFTEKPMTKLRRANKEVENMGLPDNLISNIKEAKFCAANIADHLDPLHIDGMTSLKAIIAELIQLSESRREPITEGAPA